ncbi:hypothetical protein [Rhodobacter capsulatus]|uniref:hypothetical protein n=1 Tax=Rhodobacter capsulatus TaxID=1061 RepID=UPI0040254BD8
MEFSQLAQVRFGFGPAPGRPGPADAETMLARLAGPDDLAARWPGLSLDQALAAARGVSHGAESLPNTLKRPGRRRPRRR